MKNNSSSNGRPTLGLNGGLSKSTLSLMGTPAATQLTATTKIATSTTGHQRRTSAEIVSEAKNMLAGIGGTGGARLVSTRRPITPREPRRQLYGKQAPPGRPPSSFSLRYLQFESRQLTTTTLPNLDRMAPPSAKQPPPAPSSGSSSSLSRFLRSASVDSTSNEPAAMHAIASKLPALLTPPKMTGSVDDLSAEMPPRMDFKTNRDHPTTAAVATPNTAPAYFQPHNSSAPSSADTTTKKPTPALLRSAQRPSLDETPAAKPPKVSPPKPSAAVNKKALVRNNELLVQSTTETLLDLLKAHAGLKECSDETATHINGILTELYTRVKGARGEWRGAVLGALYGLVECTSPRILVSVARVVLVLCVTGSNLTGACKLVFKVARNETNDMLFVDSDVPELLVDGLGRASPLDEPEACIYGYGAVRFLANASISAPRDGQTKHPSAGRSRQKTIAYRLARHGAVQLMVLHLQMLNEAGATVRLTGPPLHAMFQLSGALRVLAKTPSLCELPKLSESGPNSSPPCLFSASPPSSSSLLLSSKKPAPQCPQILELYEDPQEIQLDLACVHLVRAAEVCIGDTEVQTNVIRTLSVLSELPRCARALADCAGRMGMLLGPCQLMMATADAGARKKKDVKEATTTAKPLVLLVRLGYALGNVMAAEDEARGQFFDNDVAMEYLLQSLDWYAQQSYATVEPKKGADSVVDVLVKLVRVVANMSVNAEVGYGLGVRPVLGSVLLRLLQTANAQKMNMSLDMEELLLATLGALHNLSFYQDVGAEDPATHRRLPPSCVSARLADLSDALCTTLQSGALSARIEAARVLGNMTRSPVARRALCAAGGLKVLVRNLEAAGQTAITATTAAPTATVDAELVGTSCGVLVNLLSDWERRAPFRELRGPYQLRDVLQRAALQEDWLLAATVCQALWNFLIDTANIVGALGEDEADYIAGDLAEYLDEDSLFGADAQPDERWEHFAVVAADLLERIQASAAYSVSPCVSSDEEELVAARREVGGGDGAVNIAGSGAGDSTRAADQQQVGRIGDGWQQQGQAFRTWLQEDY